MHNEIRLKVSEISYLLIICAPKIRWVSLSQTNDIRTGVVVGIKCNITLAIYLSTLTFSYSSVGTWFSKLVVLPIDTKLNSCIAREQIVYSNCRSSLPWYC